ncbi:hypothetical protein LV75_002317 [Actinokineospora diospyrosa]|uniref:Uncharacterized protein n=1 Tax=Actinokineospora diospyrosa TaxID=103728 RepID=A0ABT1IB13_9PSEU|nr:hypothetical protein [Actinokineospora diospyrosa]
MASGPPPGTGWGLRPRRACVKGGAVGESGVGARWALSGGVLGMSTETFVLPVLTYTVPEAARDALRVQRGWGECGLELGRRWELNVQWGFWVAWSWDGVGAGGSRARC